MVDILAWLTAQGLEKFAPVFTKHEIDFDTLRLLTEDDVRGLGLPLGPRRKLLAALAVLRGEGVSLPYDEAERRQLTVMFVDLADLDGTGDPPRSGSDARCAAWLPEYRHRRNHRGSVVMSPS